MTEPPRPVHPDPDEGFTSPPESRVPPPVTTLGRALERIPLIVTAGLVGFAVIGAVAIGAQLRQLPPPLIAGDPSASAIASPTAPVESTGSTPGSPIVPASPSPSPGASGQSSDPAPTGIARDSIAVVVTDDLRVRSQPEVSDASKRLTPLLDRGQLVYVVDGPVAGSGYDWYQVQPLSRLQELPFGWVAAAEKGGEVWLSGEGFECPSAPRDFETFMALNPLVQLACFGEDDLTFSARIGQPEATCGADPGWTILPEWLASTCPHPEFFLADPTDADAQSWDVILDPDLDISGLHPGIEPEDWLTVGITGHRDHAAARTCRGESYETTVPLSDEQIVLTCRVQFVITSISGDTR
jgi:hypothetical protein